VFGVSSACASAAHAMMIGLTFIRSGMADVAIVGGADSCFSKGYLLAWDSLRVVSPDTVRPFSLDRRGLVIGEGAGILVLEAPGHARARGASVIGRLVGAGMSSDGGDLIVPQSDGMQRAMRAAMSEAGIAAASVDYINAHGTGTLANDRLEAHAIREVFGAHADRLSVSSTKSMIGHAMGASGALEALATLAAIEASIVPPTMNFLGADPQCDLDVTPNAPKRRNIDVALSNSFAFGGLNVSLAFAKASA
jgi:nodulation protein E